MARLDFADFNSLPMETVKNNIKKVALAKPLDVSSSINPSEPWEDPDATIIDFCSEPFPNDACVIGMDANGKSYAIDTETLASFLDPLEISDLTVGNLTVTGNTNLGDNSAVDTVTISATVLGLSCDANFAGGTVTASHFVGGDFVGTTVSATIGKFTTLEVGGQPYQPFFTADTFAADFDPYRLWIDIGNENVPIIKYCIDAANANVSTNWVALGAVFG